MDTSSRLGWYRLLGVMAVAMVIFVTLMLPPELERLRTGHWFLEHFFGYFVSALIVCIGWPRPFLVGTTFTVFAFILEGLQFWTPTHSPAVISAIGGAAGAVLAVTLAKIIMVARNSRS
jgi:VanZ family protein